jgi:hypothetical protein
VNVLRKQLAALPPFEATEVLIHALKSTHSNAELCSLACVTDLVRVVRHA